MDIWIWSPLLAGCSDECDYSNKLALKYNSYLCHSPVQIYLDIHLVNMWHPNIFWYSFTKLCGIQIYSDICLDPFYDIHSSLIFTQCATFISGNFCSLMTAKTWNISVVHCSLSLHSNHNLCKSTMHWCAACLISAYMAVNVQEYHGVFGIEVHCSAIMGWSQMMSCAKEKSDFFTTRGRPGVRQKVIFHDKGKTGSSTKSDFSWQERRGFSKKWFCMTREGGGPDVP